MRMALEPSSAPPIRVRVRVRMALELLFCSSHVL